MELEGVRLLLAINLFSHKAALVMHFVLRSREYEQVVEADVSICILGLKHGGVLKQCVPSAEGYFCSMRQASSLQRVLG